MKKLESSSQIWKTKVTPADYEESLDYATISLPWTFDRLHYGPRTQNAVNNRLWHIMSGVLNQTLLERELKARGYKCEMDWSHYRLTDIFDFKIGNAIYDVKTQSIFAEYDEQNDRERFSPDLLINNMSYPGPKWRRFFPMTVPMTQINVDHLKTGYIFGIADMPYDQRKLEPREGDGGFWCAAPWGDAHTFFHKTRLIQRREDTATGFYPVLEWKKKQSTLDQSDRAVETTLFGEWAGDKRVKTVKLGPGERKMVNAQMSSLSCVKVDHPASLGGDTIRIMVKNEFREKVPDITNPSKNLNNPKFEWDLGVDSFVNLMVSKKYVVYWIGHIPLEEFTNRFLEYPSYFIPHPKNMDENVPGKLSDDSKDEMERLDKRREKAIAESKKTPWPELSPHVGGGKIKFGLMVAATRFGRNLGAACYVYPPFAWSESALYVLPQDLYPMGSL